MTNWYAGSYPGSTGPSSPRFVVNPLLRRSLTPNGYAIVEKETNKVRKAFATELHATAATHKAKDGSLYVHSTVKHYDTTQRRWKKDHIPVFIKPFVFMEE